MKKQGEKSKLVSGNIDFDNGVKVSINLPVVVFEEDGTYFYFCPALDLNGYGKTEQLAFESLKTTLGIYFEYTLAKNTLREDLKKHGWKIPKSKVKPMIPPNLSQLLRDNIEFADIFNTKPIRTVSLPIEMPILA